MKKLLLLLGMLAVTTALTASKPSAKPEQNPKRTVIINFFIEVNPITVNPLLQLVNAQLRNGAQRITLLISSTGGETTSAFTGYNYLRGVPAEVTTFNVGNVDSAATVLYCAGKNRYSLPGTRFVLHGTALTFLGNGSMDAGALEAQLQLLKNQNQMISHVIASTTHKRESDVENALRGQTLLTAEQAKDWGLVQEIKTEFMEAGAVLVSVNLPRELEVGSKPPFEFRVLPSNPATPQLHISGRTTDSHKAGTQQQ